MAPLKLAAAGLAAALAVPAPAETVATWRPQIAEASARFALPAAWIERVIRAESGGRTVLDGRPIRSGAGAIGLMQLMPATWEQLRAELGLGRDPDDPRANILAGSFFLRRLYDRFGYPGLFAAYHAGPGRYAEHLATRRPLPDATIAYLQAITGNTEPLSAGAAATEAEGSREPLFVVTKLDANMAATTHSDRIGEGLFVVRRDVP